MTEGRCTTFVGPDRCELRAGHAGAHHTMWGEYEKRAQQRQDRPGRDESMNVGDGGGGHISERQAGARGVTDESVSDG